MKLSYSEKCETYDYFRAYHNITRIRESFEPIENDNSLSADFYSEFPELETFTIDEISDVLNTFDSDYE